MANKPYVWNEKHTDKEAKDGAYLERNYLAVLLAKTMNKYNNIAYGGHVPKDYISGWYEHGDPSYVGWQRVVSIDGGVITFHVPDDFDLGDLPEIKPNWDGSSTQEKWNYVARLCNMKTEE